MKISNVLDQFKSALRDNIKAITYHKYDWMNKFKKAYYEDYSQNKYKSNIVNQVFGLMALIAIVAILLIVTILPAIAMPGIALPGIAMLGVGLAITAGALVGIALLGRVRWKAFCEMMALQNAPDKIEDADLRQSIRLYDYMEGHDIRTDHKFLPEARKILGIQVVDEKPRRQMGSHDFDQGVGVEQGESVTGDKYEKSEKKVKVRESEAMSYASILLDRPGDRYGY